MFRFLSVLSSFLFVACVAHAAAVEQFHPIPEGPAVPAQDPNAVNPGPLDNSHYLMEMAFQYKASNHDLAYGLATSSADEFANFLKREFDKYIQAGVFDDYAFAQTLFNEYDRYSDEAQRLPFLWQASQLRIINKALQNMETASLLSREDLKPSQKAALKHAEAVLRKMDHPQFWGTCEALLQ